MNGTLIASTARGDMHPLAYQGILATDCHHQIASILRSRLGDAHVLLFAEPVFDPGRDIVDWYTPVQGTPVRLTELPGPRQAQVRATILKMAGEILALARQLKDTGDNSRVLSGNIIELALRYPGEDCIYLVGEQPVLLCWGFGPATAGAKPQDLSRLVTPAGPVIAPQTPPAGAPEAELVPPPPGSDPSSRDAQPTPIPGRPVGRAVWPRWLAAILALLLLGLLLLSSDPSLLSGLGLPNLDWLRLPQLGGPGGSPWMMLGWLLLALLVLSALLRVVPGWLRWLAILLGLALLAWLAWLLWGAGRTGVEVPTPASEARTAEPPAASALDAALARNRELRAERDGLRAGLAEKAATCPSPPAAPAKEAPPRRSNELQVPSDAGQGKAPGFLQGVWRCDSDLSTPSEPVVVEYVFDAKGTGQISIKTSDRICAASAKASMDPSGALRIESDPTIPCSQGNPIEGQVVLCRGKGTQTTCEGQNNASKETWKARFLKF